MSSNAIPTPDQGDFLECYRGRQSWLNHAAYMRMSKVLLTLQLCRGAGLALDDRAILDYGFGAGTFFRYCPRGSRLFGVEMDAENVSAVRAMLQARGYSNLDLQTIEIEHWETHPLLDRRYDIILCSHVLEHLPDPPHFLKRISQCLNPAGVFIGLVPINERVMDVHHVQQMNRAKIGAFAEKGGMRVEHYLETDHWLYWLQPVFTREHGTLHLLSQVLSIGLGLPATILGPRVWFAASKLFGALTASKPTQAAFVLKRGEVPA